MTPRVAIGPAEVAGCSAALALGLRQRGVDVELVLWSAHPFGYEGGRVLGRLGRLAYGARAPLRRDVLQYELGSTWTPRFADAYWGRAWRATLVARYHGDDCRLYGVAQRLFPARGRTGDPSRDGWVRRRVRRLARVCDAAVVADLELATYVAPFYRRVYVVPLPLYPDPSGEVRSEPRSTPVVVHAASDPKFKGTTGIRRAVEQVARSVPLDFRLLVGVSHEQVARELRSADVVIDQLDSVTSGVFALEAMRLGLPVLGEIDARALPPYQAELPLVAVTAETLAPELDALLADADRRAQLGEAGRRYVAQTHEPSAVATAMLEVYRDVRNRDPGVYEATADGIRPLELPFDIDRAD